MSTGPFIDNVSVWDLTYLETGGGSTLLGQVAWSGVGTAAFTGSIVHSGSLAMTGVGTATFTSSGAVSGAVDFSGVGTTAFTGFTFKQETLADDLTVADVVLTDITLQNILSENFKLRSYLFASAFYNRSFADSFTVDDTALTDFIAYIADGLTTGDIVSSTGNFSVFAVDSAAFDDRIYVGFPVEVLEQSTLDDTAIGIRSLISNIVSQMAVGDLPESSAIFGNSLGEVVTLDELMTHGWIEALVEAVEGSDTLSSSWVGLVQNSESITLSEALGDVLRGFLTVGDTIPLDDLNLTQQTHTLTEVVEGIHIGSLFNEFDVSGWVMNPENYAVSNYLLGFTESSVYGNDYLVADDTGLYQLGGDTDDGSAIVATITTASLDFETDFVKQVPSALLGTNGTDLVLKVSIDGTNTVFYELSSQTPTLDTKHFKIGKGLIGRNWQFSLTTKDNSDLDLDSFEFYPIVLKRKHNG